MFIFVGHFWGHSVCQLGAQSCRVIPHLYHLNTSIHLPSLEFFSSAVLILKKQLVKTVLYGNKKL